MDTLINIDNGGTLTDICVWDGERFTFTKTLTTPHDLSECLFVGIEKASSARYGEAAVERLLHEARHIRYSTTQGTNALIERRGPMIGILTSIPDLRDAMRSTPAEAEMFDALVGPRVETIDVNADPETVDFAVVQLVNRLTTLGAARIVVACETPEHEHRLREVLLRKFPRHLLGSIPIIYSWDLAGDRLTARRAWSCAINSFLHPTMERFLYGAERRLKEYRVSNPLLVYRNDGASSRVAKSIALKTYSSGPRGGLEGTAALARVYGLTHTLMMDIGGTTTDVGLVEDDKVAVDPHGTVRGVAISYPMSNVHSKGIGGSSVISIVDGEIAVGPRSVGAAPGPACFGFGGKQATITDVNLLLGILDPTTYLDGTFTLDPDRSRAVITEAIAAPLGIDLTSALIRMEAAYFAAVADSFAHLVRPESTLVAFGGAGPMSAAGAARIAGVHRVLIPRTAAVFSAVGISFSDIGKTYDVHVPRPSAQAAADAYTTLLGRAERDMFQEGYGLGDCRTVWQVVVEDAEGEPLSERPYTLGEDIDASGQAVSLRLTVTASLTHPALAADAEVASSSAVPAATRAVRSADGAVEEIPVYVLDSLVPGATGEGPALIEGPFFTARVLPGWVFRVTAAGDLFLLDTP